MAKKPVTEDLVDRNSGAIFKEYPFLDPEVEGAVSRISKLGRYLDKSLNSTLVEFGLNIAEFKLLVHLRNAGPPYSLSAGDLARAQMTSTGAMTNRIDRLEKAGFVARSPDPNDRRGVLVSLTDEGNARLDKAVRVQGDCEAELLTTLSVDEKKELNALLRKLLINFEQAMGPPPKQD